LNDYSFFSAPQLKRGPLGAPTGLVKTLIVYVAILAIAACKTHGDQSDPSVPLAGCIVVAWPDTLGAKQLPDSLRLTTEFDSTAHTSMFMMRPLRAESGPWWPELRVAVWQPMGPASFDVVLATTRLQWETKFQALGDSIDGEGQYAVGDALESFHADGHRLPCPAR
jgi:hypothetical protein